MRQDLTTTSSHLLSVGSTPMARKMLNSAEIDQIEHGVVTGIAGHILSEGGRLGFDVIALLPECNPMYPDARAAALAVEAISKLTEIQIPIDELLDDATQIEQSVEAVFQRTQNMLPPPTDINNSDPMIG